MGGGRHPERGVVCEDTWPHCFISGYITCVSEPSTQWQIVDARLAVRLPTGELVFPDAMQVLRAVFHGDLRLPSGLVSCSPVIALPHLSYQRLPAEVAVSIHRDPGGFHRASLVAGTDNGEVELRSGHDQVLHRDCWYSVRAEEVREATEWLCGFGVVAGRKITLGQVMALRTNPAPKFPVRFGDMTDAGTIASDLAILPGSNESPVIGGHFGGTLAVTPYPYQREGIAYLEYIASQDIGCILADEMGLGKTLQVIGLLESERSSGRGPSLVLTLATLLENWRRELLRIAPALDVIVHAGPQRAGLSSQLAMVGIVLSSFDTALRDEVILEGIDWNILVLDEAQAIRTPSAQRTVAIKRLRRRVSIAVTGTPVQNRLEDLWSLADFAIPRVLGELAEFRRGYPGGPGDAARVAELISPIILRRTVERVAGDLPARVDIPQAIALSDHQAQRYEEIRHEILLNGGAAAGLVAIARLRMFCAHPSLIDDAPASPDPSDGIARYGRLVEIIDEAFESSSKLLVFAPFSKLIDLLVTDLGKRWPRAFVEPLDGRVPAGDRQQVIDRFSAFDGSAVLVLNPRAAGAGLNITAASHVIHFCPEWNPAVTDQASARSHRRGQTRPVTIHHLFCADTIEEVMHARANDKRELADEAVPETDGMVPLALIERALAISPASRRPGVG